MTEVERMRLLELLKENRVLTLQLLEENNAVEFQDLLNEYPSYLHLHRSSNSYTVSFD